jgi:hypothetical protein
MICTSIIPVVVSVIGVILTYAIKVLNGVVLMTESMPGSLIKGVQLTTLQCYLLIAVLIAFIVMFRFRKFELLYVAVGLACWFSMIGWNNWKSLQKPKMIVYNVRGHSAVDIIDSGQVYNFSDSVLQGQPELGDFQMKSYRIAQSVNEVIHTDTYSFARNFSGGRLIHWNNVVMLQVTDKNFSITENLSVDYLVISNNALYNLNEVTRMIDAHHIIIDSSNSMYVANSLMKGANELNCPVYSVVHEGAFISEL